MLRCARFVAAGQQAFFRDGPRALRPMYMTEAAQALDVHLSTVSRAVKDKYLQCRQGVFPLSYFFSAPAPDGSDVSRRAVLLQLRELIDGEDKAHPLSDEKLRCLLEQKGCVLSRRTVAKYREELGIPGTAGRREEQHKLIFSSSSGEPNGSPLLLSPVGVGLDHFRSTVYLSISSWLISTPRPGFWGTAM